VDKKCGAIDIAKANDVPVKLINFDNDSEEIICNAEQIINCDLIALCGFNRILPHEFLKKIKIPVLNTHPSLLPAYGGRGMIGVKVQEAVLENNEIFAGCTVHFVDSRIDTGQHIIQVKTRTRKNETARQLGGRIHMIEKSVYWSAIKMVLESMV
jgi:phosphoribosylglycinamide formyltransferase-1